MVGPSGFTPTRRGVIRTGAGLAFGGALSGCVGNGESGTPTDSGPGTPTDSGTPGSYSVSMEPVGEVTFDAVPETWVANNGSWADMGIALGLEPPEAVWLTPRYHTQYYDTVDGVSVDKSGMTSLWQDGVSKELFYDLDADVHVIDPNFLMNRFKGWEESDVEDIEERVAPLFGNCSYAQHYSWHADYRYYSLYEAFEKLAKVFRRTDRFQAFEAVHEEFKSNVAPVAPTGGDRPEVAVLWGAGQNPNEPESFYPYVIDDGFSFKHFNTLNVRDALADTDIKDFHASRAAIDLETLLDIDPPVMMLRGYEAKSESEFRDSVVSFLQNHDIASQLTAVQNGDVHRGGGLYQGPITYMVLTERTAGQLYDFDGELFDRGRVADIVDGNL